MCVNDDISEVREYFISRASTFWPKRAKRGQRGRNVRDENWVFSKKEGEKRLIFKGEDGYKEIKREERVCFVKSWRADQAGVFQESAKKKKEILILAHVFTTLNKTHLHKHHVCCYSTNRVRRRPQGHQGSGTNEFRFASRAVKVDFERRRWEIFCYRESNQKKRAVVMKNRFFSSSSSSSSREEKKPERIKV